LKKTLRESSAVVWDGNCIAKQGDIYRRIEVRIPRCLPGGMNSNSSAFSIVGECHKSTGSPQVAYG
jgi:hypothetical protein